MFYSIDRNAGDAQGAWPAAGRKAVRMIGIIGGMSWESTAEYYRIINEEVGRKVGGLASARLLISSVDFSAYAARMESGDWEGIGSSLEEEARRLARAGAEGIVLGCTELPLLMKDGELGIPYWDTTRLHALAAADFMLGS
jgi:aspartate/glutamate racemase